LSFLCLFATVHELLPFSTKKIGLRDFRNSQSGLNLTYPPMIFVRCSTVTVLLLAFLFAHLNEEHVFLFLGHQPTRYASSCLKILPFTVVFCLHLHLARICVYVCFFDMFLFTYYSQYVVPIYFIFVLYFVSRPWWPWCRN
jgi:hypothetical protein